MSAPSITRRTFLAAAAVVGTAIMAACGGADTPTATPQPSSTVPPQPTQTPALTPSATTPPTLTPSPTALPTATPQPTPTVTPAPSSTPPLVPTPRVEAATLRALADKIGITVGCELTGGWFNNAKWKETIVGEFSLGIIAWGTFWSEIEPKRGQFDFSVADRQVANTIVRGMLLRAENMACSISMADWFTNGTFSKDEAVAILQNHIRTVMGRYKGKIDQYAITTEPYAPHRPNDQFYKKIGIEYIDIAYQTAREADPKAILIHEDAQNHTSKGRNTQQTRDIVARLASKGLVDGVGVEMHIDAANPPDQADVIQTLKSYGVPVYVSSMDVDMNDVRGSQEERLAVQATIYKSMLEAALATGICKSFDVWGISDKNSFPVRVLGHPNAAPTMYFDDFTPKPAYFAVRDALAQAQPPR